MEKSPIFILQGEERDWITQLLQKGIPDTLVISSAYIPSNEDTERNRIPFNELIPSEKEKRIRQSIVRAIVNKQHKQYVINRPEIPSLDLKMYSEIGDLYDCPIFTVEVDSEDETNTIDRGIIFTSLDKTTLLAERLMKGASCLKLITFSKGKTPENPTEIDGMLPESDLKAHLDMDFILALADPSVDLMILNQSNLTDEDQKIYKRFGRSAKCKIKTIRAQLLDFSAEEPNGGKKTGGFWNFGKKNV